MKEKILEVGDIIYSSSFCSRHQYIYPHKITKITNAFAFIENGKKFKRVISKTGEVTPYPREKNYRIGERIDYWTGEKYDERYKNQEKEEERRLAQYSLVKEIQNNTLTLEQIKSIKLIIEDKSKEGFLENEKQAAYCTCLANVLYRCPDVYKETSRLLFEYSIEEEKLEEILRGKDFELNILNKALGKNK